MKLLIGFLSFCISFSALAVTIEFPEEELAQESVLPIFENAVAVKSRLVPTAGRFEIGFASGFAMNEPFFNSLRYGGHLAYHLNETHGILLQGQLYSAGLGTNGESLAGTDLANGAGTFIRMQFAPQPKYHMTASYQITPYYGKMSLFKDFVMNLSLYGYAGLGVVDIGGETTPALNFGIGQKFYFSRRWGIRADLGMLAYQGVNYFLASDGTTTPLEDTSASNDDVTAEVPVSQFQREMNFDLNISIALIVLL